jgi:DNA (cytosine-5)-methyltransferase 1
MKVLNLYACLGGNRLLWDDCEVTAVELDPELARMYQERFPNDTVIVGDAHQYLLDHYKEFDFIWSSPPCPTHSRARFWNTKAERVYPDMKLYQEILFLQHHFNGKYVVENVIPYYEPLLSPIKLNRHLFWSNFIIPSSRNKCNNITEGSTEEWEKLHKVDISSYKGTQRKDKILRNLVHYETGKHIFDLARGIYKANNSSQTEIKF